jgi:hypothetical protein
MAAAGWAAVGSAGTAALLIWLVLARPVEVVNAVDGHELAGLAHLALTTVRDLLLRLLELL